MTYPLSQVPAVGAPDGRARYGLFADRGTPTVIGELYYATDTDELWIANDTVDINSWTRIVAFSDTSHTHLPEEIIGVFSSSQIPDLAASKITSGTLDVARIPDLNASKITSGTLDVDRLPTHTHAGTQITSGAATVGTPLLADGAGNSAFGDALQVATVNASGNVTASKFIGTVDSGATAQGWYLVADGAGGSEWVERLSGVVVPMDITVTVDPTYSDVQTERGLLELVDIAYSGIVAVTVAIEEQVSAGVWRERWATASSNTNAQYIPVKVATESGGAESTSSAHIPLRSALGWRVRVSGATSGTVTVFVSLDQG